MIFTIIMLMAIPIERPSIHKMQYMQYRNTGPSESIPLTHTPLKLKARPKYVSKTVYGFLPYWRLSHVNSIKWQDISHVACFGVELNSSGNVSNAHGWPGSFQEVIDSAHNNGVKVHLSFLSFSASDIHSIIHTYPTNTIRTILSYVENDYVEGADIDFETPYSSDSIYFANFISRLADSVHKHQKDITICLGAVNWNNRYKVSQLAQSTDGLFIMGYDYYGSWSSTSGPVAPLTGGTYNVTNSVNYYVDKAGRADKIILGVPYYGHEWITQTGNAYSSTVSSVGAQLYNTAVQEAQSYGLLWDQTSNTPWYRHYTSSQWHQVWFDNDSSLSLKYQLSLDRELQGIGIWALTYDDTRSELWNLIEKFFGGDTFPAPKGFACLYESPQHFRLLWYDDNASSYEIYESNDGKNFTYTTEISDTQYVTQPFYANTIHYFKIRGKYVNGYSAFTPILAARTASDRPDLLIVNGFNGIHSTGNEAATHASVLDSLGINFVSSVSSRVNKGDILLQDYNTVDWIVGDKDTSTFTHDAQSAIQVFLAGGNKNFFASGSNIGHDLMTHGDQNDSSFYCNFLKSGYSSNSAGTHELRGVSGSIFGAYGSFIFDDGRYSYNVSSPDAIYPVDGAQAGLVYSTGDTALIYFEGFFGCYPVASKLVYMAVPFESVQYDTRKPLMETILKFFGYDFNIAEGKKNTGINSFSRYIILHGEKLRIANASMYQKYFLYDEEGRLTRKGVINGNFITLPKKSGIFFIKLQSRDSCRSRLMAVEHL